MRRLVDIYFVRFSLAFIGILLVSHVAWFQLMYHERIQVEAHYAAEDALFLVDAVRQRISVSPNGTLPSRVRLIDPSSPEVPPKDRFIPEPSSAFVEDIRTRMRAGTDVRVGPPGKAPMLWIRGPGDPRWTVVPVNLRLRPRLLDGSALLLPLVFLVTLILTLVAAWMLLHPLPALTEAVNRFGRERGWSPVPERGPFELRLLTCGFNEMASKLKSAEYDRAVMLEGVAHDLRTPLTRLRLRAENLDDASIRADVIRDVNSMARVIETFVAPRHDAADVGTPHEKG